MITLNDIDRKNKQTIVALGVEGVQEDPVGADAAHFDGFRIEIDARRPEHRAVCLAGVFGRQLWQNPHLH